MKFAFKLNYEYEHTYTIYKSHLIGQLQCLRLLCYCFATLNQSTGLFLICINRKATLIILLNALQ